MLGALGRVDPWALDCGRTNCFPCKSEPGKCSIQGVVYQITCVICKEKGVETQYYGESARTCFDRGVEHLTALEKMNLESPLVEHHFQDHPQEDPKFEMKAKSFHDKPLHRQCEEAHLIEAYTGDKIMNRKGEWGHNLPPKLSIEGEGETSQIKRGRPTNRSQNHDAPQNSKNGVTTVGDLPEPKPKRRRTGFQPPAQPVDRQKPAPLTAKQILNKLWSDRHVTYECTNTDISPNTQIGLTYTKCARQDSNSAISENQ